MLDQHGLDERGARLGGDEGVRVGGNATRASAARAHVPRRAITDLRGTNEITGDDPDAAA